VKVPAGIQDAKSIRLSGRGEAGRNGGPAGDLIVRVRVTPHPVFSRKDDHLTISVPISIAEASLGAEVSVPVLMGSPLKLKIPAGTMSGKTFRLKGRGVQSGKRQGDLLVTVEIAVNDLYGGVFDAACQPTNDGKEVLPIKVNVSDDSGTVRKDIAVEYDEFTGSCSGQVELILPPLGEYRVSSGSDTIAIVESQEVFSGKDFGTVDAVVYRSIGGIFSLHDEFRRCNASMWCWWDDYHGIEMTRSDYTQCQGMNGYSDIYPGTSVYIYGNSNGQSAFSTLGTGSETWPSPGDLTHTCTFEWAAVTLPYDPFGYSIEISSRGTLSYSLEEIEYSDGVVSSYLGTP
jgi:hypothetical protein